MGRTITIELNEHQRAELEQGYRKGTKHCFRQRCHLVLLKAEGRKSKDIADLLGLCEQSVNSWLWRYKSKGISGLQTKHGQGRIAILQQSQDAAAVRLAVAQQRQRLSLAHAELENTLGKKFSEKTLRRFLKNLTADINASANDLPKRRSKNSTTGKSRS